MIKRSVKDSSSAITDIQRRSMRDTLHFTGIEESDISESDFAVSEKVVCDVLENEMNIEKTLPFHRVHRIGNLPYEYDTPRPIVANCKRFNDREEIRSAAPRTLKGKHFGIREQFPKVVEDKRKTLYSLVKEARNNKQNKVRHVRDKLFINNIVFVPDSSAGPQAKQNRSQTRLNKQSGPAQPSKESSSDVVQVKDGNVSMNIDYGKIEMCIRANHAKTKGFPQQ